MKRYKWIKLLKSAKEMFLLQHHFQFHTSLPKKRILRWIELFVQEYWDDYSGWLEDDGFIIDVKSRGRNQSAPTLKARIIEKEDGSVIDATLGAPKSSQIMLVLLQCLVLYSSFYYYQGFCVFLFLIAIHFLSVFLPARKLKERLVSYFEQETDKK